MIAGIFAGIFAGMFAGAGAIGGPPGTAATALDFLVPRNTADGLGFWFDVGKAGLGGRVPTASPAEASGAEGVGEGEGARGTRCPSTGVDATGCMPTEARAGMVSALPGPPARSAWLL